MLLSFGFSGVYVKRFSNFTEENAAISNGVGRAGIKHTAFLFAALPSNRQHQSCDDCLEV